MNREAIAEKLVRKAAFVDQPVPWGQETEDQLEKEQAEAEQKLKRELREVKGRYYWEPGHTLSINITLTGRPLLMDYRMGGMFGISYRDGILTVNPQWVSTKDDFPSYAWAKIADKMIQLVKQSPKVSEMADKTLDMAEGKLGFKIQPDVRRSIIRWCEMAAERRLSVHAYPGPKGKEFTVSPQGTLVTTQASSKSAAMIQEGDVCKVDIREAQRAIGGGFGTVHQLKILRDVVRQGDGKVDVEEVRGDNAMVSAHDNPMSKIMGDVQVPVSALTKVASSMSKTAETGTRLKLVRKPSTDEWVVRVWVDGKYDDDKSYYTDDKQDAIQTMAAMKKEMGITASETRSDSMNKIAVAKELVAIAKELAAAETFKCPDCGTKVLENTGYCVKCEKKVKKAE